MQRCKNVSSRFSEQYILWWRLFGEKGTGSTRKRKENTDSKKPEGAFGEVQSSADGHFGAPVALTSKPSAPLLPLLPLLAPLPLPTDIVLIKLHFTTQSIEWGAHHRYWRRMHEERSKSRSSWQRARRRGSELCPFGKMGLPLIALTILLVSIIGVKCGCFCWALEVRDHLSSGRAKWRRAHVC